MEKNIDNLVGMNEEVAGEGWEYHEKKYRGVIRSNFFEAKTKHEMGELWTYNPWIIRGDFKGIGSNIELSVKTELTKGLRNTRMIFLVLPFILFFGTLITKKLSDPSSVLALVVSALIVVFYHIISRWLQFSAIQNFIKKLAIDEDRIDQS